MREGGEGGLSPREASPKNVGGALFDLDRWNSFELRDSTRKGFGLGAACRRFAAKILRMPAAAMNFSRGVEGL